jgi:hypothetical protein
MGTGLQPGTGMKTLQDIHPRIYPLIRDCPASYIIQATREAINEFCRESLIWQHTLPSISLLTSQKSYAISSNVAHTSIHRVLNVVADEVMIRPASEYNWSVNKEAIDLVANPPKDVANGLVVTVALKLTQEATELHNDRLWDDYLDVFVSGTAAQLLSHKGTPWSDIQMAARHRLDFLNGIGRAKHEVRRNRQFILNTATATFKFI